MTRTAFRAEEDRRALYDRFVQAVGPLSTRTMTGYPAFPVTRLNDPQTATDIARLLRDTVEAARA